jgi:flavin-dependent thymidylate synthase
MNQPEIQVRIIGGTAPAGRGELPVDKLLVYTKATRLEQGKDTRKKVMGLKPHEVKNELDYMANTIPSSWEMVDYVFEILNVTRAFTHQFVRTRTGSYAQQTMRLLEKKGFTYRIPPQMKGNENQLFLYNRCMKEIQETYDGLLADGAAAEDARGILPTNVHTNIIAKFNLRTLAEMARSRTGTRTQDEYREVMDLMLNAVTKLHPWTTPFLFPEEGKHIKALEQEIIRLHQSGSLTTEKKMAMLKDLDALRKGKS